MRVGAITIGRATMHYTGGISKHLMIQMFNALPEGSKIVGFTEDHSSMTSRIFVEHPSFKDTGYSSYYPQIMVWFTKQPNGIETFDRMDFSQVLEVDPNQCVPDWRDYQGVMDAYKYCHRCGKKEGQHA